MNHIERGALQQQRVLTFNDFLPMHQKGWNGCMHVVMSMECSITSSTAFFLWMLCRTICFHWSLLQKWRGMMLYSVKGLCINVNMLLHYVYLISLAAATLCPSPASHCSCINLSIFVSTYYAAKYEKRVFSQSSADCQCVGKNKM